MEHGPGGMIEVLAILAAAAICVPLAGRLGLGSVLGYLIGGAAIGPWGLGIVSEVEDIRHLAEFGVVFLLFIIGIEMKPSRLWVMRRQVFGLGGLQVLITGALLGGAAHALGLSAQASVMAGLGLALSSTAMGLQLLSERGEMASTYGRSAFAILLLQDLTVPVLLALVPLLADGGRTLGADLGVAVAEGLVVLGLVLGGGRLLLRPALRIVARARSAELFTATALLIVLGMGVAMERVGLSMAMGAFLAGLLLADSEFRHQIEGDIQPFRGLLLGLFFMGVGMTVDFGQLFAQAGVVLGLVVALLTVKAAVMVPLCRAFGLTWADSVRTAALLSQGGEFAFVLFSFATGHGVMPAEETQLLVLVVSLSMAVTPLMALVGGRIAKRLQPEPAATAPQAVADDHEGHVIIAGFGRVGRTVAAMLQACGRRYVAFDLDLAAVQAGRDDGLTVYYGDASRPEVLRAARAESAALLVVTMDDQHAVTRAVVQVRGQYPALKILARARDLAQSKALRSCGATSAVPETLEASLQLAASALGATGVDAATVSEVTDAYRADHYTPLTETVGESR